MKYTNQFIGCCGLDCEKCDARIATITDDNALREKTAMLWTKLNGVTITPEMINCTGRRIKGAKTPFCDKLCPVHNCVREKELESCADCGQMDGCPTLRFIATNSPVVLENLKKATQCKTERNKLRIYYIGKLLIVRNTIENRFKNEILSSVPYCGDKKDICPKKSDSIGLFSCLKACKSASKSVDVKRRFADSDRTRTRTIEKYFI